MWNITQLKREKISMKKRKIFSLYFGLPKTNMKLYSKNILSVAILLFGAISNCIVFNVD